MSASEPVPDDEEEDVEEIVPENTVSFDNVAEGFRLFKTFLTSFMAWTVL